MSTEQINAAVEQFNSKQDHEQYQTEVARLTKLNPNIRPTIAHNLALRNLGWKR